MGILKDISDTKAQKDQDQAGAAACLARREEAALWARLSALLECFAKGAHRAFSQEIVTFTGRTLPLRQSSLRRR